MPLLILYEHAVGYTLFQVQEFEEIASFLKQLDASVKDLSRFNQVVSLVAFGAFQNSVDALDAINSLSEGIVPTSLLVFLQDNFPKSRREGKYILGVRDKKIAAQINEKLQIKCQFTGVIPHVSRGIGLHFQAMVPGMSKKKSNTSFLGLGHAYSRAKIKFNTRRVDNNIIHSIACVDMFEKDINKFSMRLREWYSYHFPELWKIVPNNILFAKAVAVVRDRQTFDESKLEELGNVLNDHEQAQYVLEAARTSMGMDLSTMDLDPMMDFTKRIISLSDRKGSMGDYMKKSMNEIAPNLSALIGEQVGARLISHAGSLVNLAKFPASTVQILGAEKALFRALKTKGKTPKYGLIYNSSHIGKAKMANKGRISRFLANKCSIASRIDSFSDNNGTNVFGMKMKQQVEDRLTFYEMGVKPAKNVDVMEEATGEVVAMLKKEKKKGKKRKKAVDEEVGIEEPKIEVLKKKKKSKKNTGLI